MDPEKRNEANKECSQGHTPTNYTYWHGCGPFDVSRIVNPSRVFLAHDIFPPRTLGGMQLDEKEE